MLLMLAWNTYVLGALMVLFLIICGLVILTVLVQRPQGGGLAGAFGGGSGSGQTAFGTKTGDALTVLTISMFVVYLLAAILLNYGTKAAANAGDSAPVISLPEPVQPKDAPSTAPTTGPAGTPANPPTPVGELPANPPAASTPTTPATPQASPAEPKAEPTPEPVTAPK